MKKKLKIEIINFIFENEKEFQLTNAVTNNFREYVYNSKGDYLIGGEDVLNFIRQAIELITNN